jgi:hypothetical protein
MRGVVPYLLAGILVVLTLDVAQRAVGSGLAVGAQPIMRHGAIIQHVDRMHKGDRLPLPRDIGKQLTPDTPRGVMIGCEPVFSPLSTAARVIVPGRCTA